MGEHDGHTIDVGPVEVLRTPRQRWGTCCPFDPECRHSYIDNDALFAWMDRPLNSEEAVMTVNGFNPDSADDRLAWAAENDRGGGS